MTVRIPLVQDAGQIEQLQAGDTIAVTVPPYITAPLTNGNAGAITVGQAVYASAPDTVDLARADNAATKQVIGIVFDATIAPAALGNIALTGIVTASTAAWDALTGDTGGLVVGARYFLDPGTDGSITQTAPSVAGQYIKQVGVGISTTELDVSIQDDILL